MATYENVLKSRPLLSLARDFQVEWMTLERASVEGRLPESFFWFVGTTLAVSPEDRPGVSVLLASANTWDGTSQPPRPLLDDMVRRDPEGSRTAVQQLARLADTVQALRDLFADPNPKTPHLHRPVGNGPVLTGLAAALLGAGDVLVDHDHGSPVCVDPDHPATGAVLASYPTYYAGRQVCSAVPAQVLDEVVGWCLPRALDGSESESLSDFWSFVDECQASAGLHLDKAEGSPVLRCLKVYYAVHDVYGDRGALLAYVTRLAPVLYGLASGLAKTEREFAALLKAGTEAPTTRQLPGRAQTADGDLELLSERPEHYVARPAGGGRAFLLPKKAENSSYVVHSSPPPPTPKLDADLHGVARYNRHPEQRALIHGADPSQWNTTTPAHAFGGYGRWVNVADGRLAYLKPGMVREAEQEATYHNLAHDFFGLGAHVPTTAVFDDPATGERKSISECVVGAEHVRTSHLPHHRQILHALATTGDLDRLAVMDGVMGHDDRDGRTNYVFGNGTLHLIDNGAFERPELPHYWTSHHGPDGMGLPLHPAAAEWVKGLDPAEFQRQLESHGMSHEVVAGRVRALEDLRAALAHKGPALTRQEAWQALRGDGLVKSEVLIKADVVRPSSTLQGDEGYLYHATNEERAHGIAEDGRMHLHKPGDFTEQDCWPDGATEKRSGYFAPHDKAHTVWSFAPEEGRSAVLRIHHLAHPFRRESGTGDLFSKKAVPAKLFEVNTSEGWKPLVDWHRGISKSEDLSKAVRAKKAPAPEPKLVALHGLSAPALLHAHKYGGFAAPSIGVANVEQPMDRYGEITLVGDQNLGDPKKNPVFDADVYSPRHPKTVNKILPKPWKALAAQLAPHMNAIGYTTEDLREGFEDGNPLGRSKSIENGLALAYLKQVHGLDVPKKMKPRPTELPWVDTPPVHAFFQKYPDARKGLDYEDPRRQELGEAVKAGISHHVGNVIAASEGVLDEGDRDFMEKTHRSQFFDRDGSLHFSGSDRIAREYRDVTDPHKASVVDRSSYHDAIEQAIEPHKEDFRSWVAQKVAQVTHGPFIRKVPSERFDYAGNRRPDRHIPYSLDNVLKIMKRTIRAGETFNYGVPSTRAKGARRFRTLEEMKRHAGRLVTEEDMARAKEDVYKDVHDLSDELSSYHPSSSRSQDAMLEALGESFKRGRMLHRELQTSGFTNVPPELVRKIQQFGQKLRDMPTEYFEGKPQRVVSLHEFRGAAVPHDVHPSVLEALNQYGMHVETYPRNDTEARRRAVEKIAQARNLFLSEFETNSLYKNSRG
jgi:hypothetical protein